MPCLVNPRHELFAQGLAAGKTQLQAFDEAGFSAYDSSASRMAARPHIKRRVQEILRRAALTVEVSKARVVNEIARLAFFNPADVLKIEESGKATLDLSALDRDMACAIDISVQISDDGTATTKVKLADAATRKGYIELLCKVLGYAVERHESGQPGDFSAIESTSELVAKLKQDLGEHEAETFLALMQRPSPSDSVN